MKTILETTDLKKYYGSGETQVRALDGVSISFRQGEFAAIVGTSGSGKSTLLHMLGGLDRPTSGKVIVDGKDIFKLKDDALCIFRRRKIGFVFQSYNLVPVLNVEENITLPIELDGNRIDRAFIREIIQVLGLEQKLHSLPGELSGGQQQRVAIARALALEPDVLCFDEPTSALDPELTGEVLRVIRSLKNNETTMIVVTHEMEFAKHVSDKIIFMADGVIEASGAPRQLFEEQQNPRLQAFLQTMQQP